MRRRRKESQKYREQRAKDLQILRLPPLKTLRKQLREARASKRNRKRNWGGQVMAIAVRTAIAEWKKNGPPWRNV